MGTQTRPRMATATKKFFCQKSEEIQEKKHIEKNFSKIFKKTLDKQKIKWYHVIVSRAQAHKKKGKKMNTTLFLHLINLYNNLAYTHLYIFGFEYKGLVYMVGTNSSLLPQILTLDKASRDAGYSIRFKPTTEQKLFLLSHAKVLCSKEFFDAQVAGSKYNRGEIFEKLVTEHFGQTWVKDSIPFTEAGDIEVNGVAYQIKYEKATFASEKSLARLSH